ncbi:MAG: hypothetical protein HKN07_05100, partial [Acidimicrobiia bacterium]|nr:hypothetical protein [Acidimicrobiia bacterium]
VLVSDHGDLGGDHGVFRKGPMQTPGLSHVPLIVRGPSIPAGAVSGSCGSIDIGPTMLSLAGLDPRRGMTGVALPLDGTSPDRRWVLTETESTSLTFGRPDSFRLRGIRNHRWHLVHSNDPGLCELHDLDDDPHEQHNRWSDPALAATRSDLMMALADTALDHTEQGITPWSPG